MRVTTKGQVTIPQDLRQLAGIFPGAEVEFSLADGIISLKKTGEKPSRGERLLQAMRGTLRPPMRRGKRLSTDEMMALLRG